jgi:voltage-gated sodium channel
MALTQDANTIKRARIAIKSVVHLSKQSSVGEAYDTQQQQLQRLMAEEALQNLADNDTLTNATTSKILRERNRRIERFKEEENEHTFKAFVDLYSDLAFEIVRSSWFESVVLLVICVGFGCSCANTFEDVKGSPELIFLEQSCVFIFFVEFLMKVLSDGLQPWRYFTGPFRRENTFDFAILIGCSPFIPKGSQHVAVAMQALRLFRLVTVMGTQYKNVEMMVTAITAGFEELIYISVPSFIVFYIYAIMGIVFFRENDPFHWQNVGMSLNTLVRLLTLEDWTDELYINYYGCDYYDGGIYASPSEIASAEVTDPGVVPRMFTCGAPKATPWKAIWFFMSFAVLTVVLTAMFIGAISIALNAAVTLHITTAHERKKEMRKVRGQVALYKQIESCETGSWRYSSY